MPVHALLSAAHSRCAQHRVDLFFVPRAELLVAATDPDRLLRGSESCVRAADVCLHVVRRTEQNVHAHQPFLSRADDGARRLDPCALPREDPRHWARKSADGHRIPVREQPSLEL